ncbi:hypothetical protein TNCT_258411 [Trichonephila clavata]|uniref:Uncharacterized protein n=1 Tax=Trichonephila clavata TaxID=2740835 RepID=A0A8X6GEI5_TRICU|nr:hypothetical protein TNCT_258411 [Trichonephila clavata]
MNSAQQTDAPDKIPTLIRNKWHFPGGRYNRRRSAPGRKDKSLGSRTSTLKTDGSPGALQQHRRMSQETNRKPGPGPG